jgi:hypothetical protein
MPPSNNDISFGQERLNSIFKVSAKYPDKLTSRESSWLEFKENFNFGSLSKYAKTMAAFANTQGGYIVFGIKDNPHRMVGIREEDFSNINPERLTNELNELFSPEIAWEIHVHEFNDKTFGLICSHESNNKPVMAKKNSGEVKEAEIYYRYRGRSEKIKYSELLAILDDRRKQEQSLWMNLLEKIAKIGVQDAAVFDTNTGEVSGTSASFIIDEGLLDKLRFIKEGQIEDKDGSPIHKLIGALKTAGKGSILPVKRTYTDRTRGIRTDDIITDFLNQKIVDNPMEYIKQICWESAFHLPVYYYIVQSKKTLQEVIYVLKEVKTRSPSHAGLLGRLSSSREYKINIPPNSASRAAKQKSLYRQTVLKRLVNLNSFAANPVDLKYLLQSMRAISKSELDSTYVLGLLKNIFDSYYTQRNPDISGDIRYTVCHVDVLMCRDKVKR